MWTLKTISLAAINVIGITLYLLLASRGWRDPSQADIPITWEPYAWAVSLPVIVFVILLDIAWGIILVIRRDRLSLPAYVLCILLLSAAVTFDFMHH
jgi:hypothetical protein